MKDETKYVRSNNLVMRQIADQAILIPITQIGADLQKVYTLNHSAAAVWQCLEHPLTIEKLSSQLAAVYNQDINRNDIEEIINFFVENKFCMIIEGP